MSRQKNLYESASVWDQQLQLGQKNLVQAIRDFFPTDVETVLDVGCGDGKITGAIIQATGKSIVGLDSSAEALSRCAFETIHGDATALPFADGELDMVLTADTLEHLPDDIEQLAWQQLFRVAAKAVMVAVPFREELLEATSRCAACATHYHVNWHWRSYDWPQLIARAPAGWSVSAVVFTGEPWSPYHPIETRLRRHLFDEWSGWTDSVCPACGSKGHLPDQISALSAEAAVALGRVIYASRQSDAVVRHHSEILLLYRHDGSTYAAEHDPATVRSTTGNASRTTVMSGTREANLIPYPQAARTIRASDGSLIVQLPVYATEAPTQLLIKWAKSADRPVPLTLEDGLGVLYSDVIHPHADGTAIGLPRQAEPGYFGALVRLPMGEQITSVQLGWGPTGLNFAPDAGALPGYHKFDLAHCPAFVQITRADWINLHCLSTSAASLELTSWTDLLAVIEKKTNAKQAALKAQHDALTSALNLVQADNDAWKPERDAMQAARSTLKCDHAACKSELDALKLVYQARLIERVSFELEHSALKLQCDRLDSAHGALKSTHHALNLAHEALTAERDQLQLENHSLKSAHLALTVAHQALAARPEVRFFSRLRVKLRHLHSVIFHREML